MLALIASGLFLYGSGVVRDIRHPAMLTLLVWLVPFLLLSIPVIKFIPLPAWTTVYVLVCVLLLALSATLSALVRVAPRPMQEQRGIGIITALGWLALATALYYNETKWGLINLITNPGEVRASDEGGTGLLGMLVYAAPLCFNVIIGFIALRRAGHDVPAVPLAARVFLVACLAYMLILPERTTLINTLVWSALMWVMAGPPITVRLQAVFRTFIPAALLLTVALGFFINVSERTGKVRAVQNMSYAINMQSVPHALIDPYMYLTASIPAFEQQLAISYHDDASPLKLSPERTVLFPRRVLQIVTGDTGKLTANAEFARIPFPFNTYGFSPEIASDTRPDGAPLDHTESGLISAPA